MKASKAYNLFLQGVRREKTSVIGPDIWNLLINNVVLKWINMKQNNVERNQSFDDDLSIITVTTDGLPFYPLLQLASNVDVKVFPVPEKTFSNTKNTHKYDDENKMSYPDYLRLLNIRGIDFDGNEIKLTSLKTNEEDEILTNEYTTPSIEECYYRVEDGSVYYPGGRVYKVYSGDIDIVKIKLSYLRNPIEYFLDESNPSDNVSNVDHVRGKGSVPLEFDDLRTTKIIDMAVRLFLEIKGDPRYKSLLNEQVVNKIIK
ncbi:MAG: hypothetical protein DRP97_00995 [Candidatus Latescibacterota bacterium]|nr:MAG: hypothetical protein DRP97_00995 [Candidatus Latescibacterota bacterium]